MGGAIYPLRPDRLSTTARTAASMRASPRRDLTGEDFTTRPVVAASNLMSELLKVRWRSSGKRRVSSVTVSFRASGAPFFFAAPFLAETFFPAAFFPATFLPDAFLAGLLPP